MKHYLAKAVRRLRNLIGLASVSFALGGCLNDAQQKDLARAEEQLHTAAQIACIVQNAFLPSDEAIAKACNILPAFWYLIHPVAVEHKLALQLAEARRTGLVCK